MRMRPVLLCLSLVVMVSSLEAFIDCETSCNKCKDNADDPEIVDVYCSMCSECTERLEAQRGSTEQKQDTQSREGDGHKQDHEEEITPMPPLPDINDGSIPDQTNEGVALENLLRPRKPAPRIEKPANQWKTNQMPRLLPPITATQQPVINKRKRQRVPLKQRSPMLRKPVEEEARFQGNSCPFAQAQGARNQAIPRALRQDYLNWPAGCPIPPICSDDDSYEEVTRRLPEPPVFLHATDPPSTKHTKTTTTTTTTKTTTVKPTCPSILTCRKKRIRTPMPCAVSCMPMCCPPMPYNGNNGMPFNGNNGVPGIVSLMPNIGNNLPQQYTSQTGNINSNNPLNAIEDIRGNDNINVYNPNGNNANGPGNMNTHLPNNNMPINANEDNRHNTNVYDPSGNNLNAQNSIVQNGNIDGQMDNGHIQSELNVQTGNSQIDQNSIVQHGNNQNPQNGKFRSGNNQNAQNGNVQYGNNQNAQNGYVQYGNNQNAQNGNINHGNNHNAHNGNFQQGNNHNAHGNNHNAQNGIVQNAINQNGENYNIQNNGHAINRLPDLIDQTNYNQAKSNNLISANQGSNSGGKFNVNGNRFEVSTDYYNLYVGVPLGLLGPGTDPWRRSQQAQKRNVK